MRVADTSALYAFFVSSDQHHAAARRAMARSEIVWVPSEILAETMALLQRRIGAHQAWAAGEFLWSQPHTEIQPSTTARLMSAWGEFQADGRLSFADAVVVASCRDLDASPLAFDRRIQRALRRSPPSTEP